MTDPGNDNAKVQDLQKKRELNDAAKDLLENKAFLQAIIELRKRWFDELMTAAETKEQRDELIAKMKALEAIPTELTVIMNNYKMGLRQQQRHA
jgi:flagellar motor switch/type III secretory pathway protein FliN